MNFDCLTFRERNEISDLVESGDAEREDVGGKSKHLYRYRALRYTGRARRDEPVSHAACRI
jgi:hypothetical protein